MNTVLDKYRNCPVQVKASFWFLMCAFLQKGISVITTPVFTRLLSTVEYGRYNVFNSWLGIIGIFVSLNLSAGVYTQGLVKFEEEAEVFSSSLQGLSVFLTACWTAVYFLFRGFWNRLFSLSTVQMLSMLVMIWASAAFGFWAVEQRVHYQYRMLVFVTLAASVAKPAAGIFFVIHAEDKVTARILGLALVELVMYTGLFFAQMSRGRKFYSFRFWKYALMFNLPLVPHYLSQTVLNSADRIMIERITGAGDAGIYSLAYSVALIMTLFNTALSQTLSPWIYQKIKAGKIKDIAPVAYITLMVIAAVNILLIAFAPEAVAVFAPESYHSAVWVMPPVAMSVYFMFSYDLFAKFAFYYEKTRFIMAASVTGAVLNIVLNYIFISRFGYRAAGYTTLFCYVVYDIGHYFFMNRICDEFCGGVRPYELKKILAVSVLFVLTGFILLFTYNHVVLRYGVTGILMAAAVVKRKSVAGMLGRLVAVRRTEA
ncbi:MAG: oligosaccharide flippase family protein [Eubacterium sp.]|nr:oligosaccharide flippase family protein [Eubacterium sp.]